MILQVHEKEIWSLSINIQLQKWKVVDYNFPLIQFKPWNIFYNIIVILMLIVMSIFNFQLEWWYIVKLRKRCRLQFPIMHTPFLVCGLNRTYSCYDCLLSVCYFLSWAGLKLVLGYKTHKWNKSMWVFIVVFLFNLYYF